MPLQRALTPSSIGQVREAQNESGIDGRSVWGGRMQPVTRTKLDLSAAGRRCPLPCIPQCRSGSRSRWGGGERACLAGPRAPNARYVMVACLEARGGVRGRSESVSEDCLARLLS